MLSADYTEEDLKRLTEEARTLWEYDFISTPKRIQRRKNVVSKKVPLRAIYRMAVDDWASSKFHCYKFPFSNGGYTYIIGLAEGWEITAEDRKFIEKDMVLVASNRKTLLILPDLSRRWWESTWFNATSLLVGVLGLLFGLFK